jgi:hypothetical protein
MWLYLCIPSFIIQFSATQFVSSLFHPSQRVVALTVVLIFFIEGSFIKYQFFNFVLNSGYNYGQYFLFFLPMRLYRIETAALVIPFVFLLPAAYYFIKISPYPQDHVVA